MKMLRIFFLSLVFFSFDFKVQSQDSLDFQLLLIGDAGDFNKLGAIENLNLAKSKVNQSQNTAIVFLGDNIYPTGLVDESNSVDRKDGELKLGKQLDIAKGKCPAYIIPGNHDWNHWSPGGKAAALRSEKFIENYGNNLFQTPSNACSGPEVSHLTDNIILIAIDSQWWLQKWKNEPDIHTGCGIKSRDAFLIAFKDTIAKYSDKRVIVGMHHPVFSKGPHGGRYTLKEHIFPLTMFNEKLFIPLPVLGSIAIALRAGGASRQDLNHPLNKKLMNGIQDAIKNHPNIAVVSGHEHSLQHFYQGEKNYIISGGGCKNTHLGKSKKMLYGKSIVGFGVLKFYKNSTYLEFYSNQFGKGERPMYTGFLF